jgi:hypothetical protein
VVEVAQERSTVHPGYPALRIDPDASHARQVDDDPAVARREARDAVATAADGDPELLLARVSEGREDVGHARRPDHDGGPPVDHPVPYDPGRVVAGVFGQNRLAGEALAEPRERRRIERGGELSRHELPLRKPSSHHPRDRSWPSISLQNSSQESQIE